MTLQKNNRYKEYVLELEQIKYNYLDKTLLDPQQRRFWVKRESLIKKQIEDYLNTYDDQTNRIQEDTPQESSHNP
tara:strand:- start:22 stop:246 length:225 start_codon:yes stop_codon:yes gene_type:complete